METEDGASPYAACTEEAIIKLGMFMYCYLQVHACKTMVWGFGGMRAGADLCLAFLIYTAEIF